METRVEQFTPRNPYQHIFFGHAMPDKADPTHGVYEYNCNKCEKCKDGKKCLNLQYTRMFFAKWYDVYMVGVGHTVDTIRSGLAIVPEDKWKEFRRMPQHKVGMSWETAHQFLPLKILSVLRKTNSAAYGRKLGWL